MSNARIAAAVAVLSCWCSVAPAVADAPAKLQIIYDPAADFVAFNPDYKQLKGKYRGEMSRKRILARLAALKSADLEIRLARLMLGASTFVK